MRNFLNLKIFQEFIKELENGEVSANYDNLEAWKLSNTDRIKVKSANRVLSLKKILAMTDELLQTKIYRFKKLIRLPANDLESADGSESDNDFTTVD